MSRAALDTVPVACTQRNIYVPAMGSEWADGALRGDAMQSVGRRCAGEQPVTDQALDVKTQKAGISVQQRAL